MKHVLPLLLVAFAICLAPAAAQSPQAASPQSRAEAYVAALSANDPGAFEALAQSAFTPAAAAARTPAQRADMLTHIHGDFGAMQITNLAVDGDHATVQVRGATGLAATIQLTFEGADYKISRASIQVNMGGNGPQQSSLPPAPLTGDMNSATMSAALDRWMAPIVEADNFAGVVLIAHNGQPLVTRAYGPASRAPITPANTNTIYNIASIGKRFTMTAIGRLIQEGRLTLDTTIGEVIPDYPNAESRSATVRQLITMQGGIADIFSPAREALPSAQFSSNHAYYQFVSSQPPHFAPGTNTEYCNGCYVVLGEMIERLSGRRFEDYIQHVVFTPAHMTHTGYFNTARLPANTARSYRRNAQGVYEQTSEGEGVSGCGAGGVYATAADLLAFDNALRDGRLLNAQWSAWVVGGDDSSGARNTAGYAVQGGGPGVSAEIDSDGAWAVIVLANVHRPVPFDVAAGIAHAVGL